MICFHIHGCHQQDRLYLIQQSTSTSTSMLATPMIICIRYNDPPWHQASSLLRSFIFDTMILWSSWYIFYSLHSSPLSHNEVLTLSGLQHLCLALVLWILALAEAWWRCWIRYHLLVHTSLEFCHLQPPHGWNDIVGGCALSSHGIYCPLPVRWLLDLDCCMRWSVVFFSSSNLFHKTSQPDPLLGCMHQCDVFCLCTQQQYDSLLFGAPWDHPNAEMERESGYWVPVLLTSPVCIAESFYHCFLLSSEGKPKIFHASEIVNDLF